MADTIEITASYARKINHAMYGGNEYESSDTFCSMKEVISAESDPVQAYEELVGLCKEAVDNHVQLEIDEMGGLDKETFEKWKYDYVAERPVDEETYHKMSKKQMNDIQLIKKAKATLKRDNQKEDGSG
jgi:archaellum biogenesis ATPase FlaH